jgi:signal transduction histidine kinase
MTDLQQNFINTISHELRNPLGFIKGYTTTLLREDTQWDKLTQTDFLRIIERETNHLQELIDNLLDSSRLQSGQMSFDWQIVRLDSLIRDEVSRARINNPNLEFHLDFDAVVPPIHGDPNRLAQVIDNLINNSIKYAPGADIYITIRHTGKTILVDYRDAGPGLSEKYLSQIFERFFRDPDQSIKVHGSGLGLSICQEIIEKHLGEISASCPPGWGLSFSIHLPVDLESSSLNELEAK